MAEAGIEDVMIDVVDVVENPERAEIEGILATPTLVRDTPPPRRRVVGDLADLGVVRAALGLPQMYPVARGATD